MASGKYQEWLTKEGLLKIEGWARDGLTDEQIAHNMGITKKTIYEWKKKYGDICDSLKRGKEVIDREVENALLKRALGYTYNEVTQEADEFGELAVSKVVTKQVSPDVTAQIFWLKNRKPTEWRDRKETELSGSIETTSRTLSDEELKEKIRDLEVELGMMNDG